MQSISSQASPRCSFQTVGFRNLNFRRRHLYHRVNQCQYSLQLACKSASLRWNFRPCLALSSGEIPSPAEADPLEVDEDEDEEKDTTKFDKIWRASQKARKQEEEYYRQNRSVFREAVGLDPDGGDVDDDDVVSEGQEIVGLDDREDADFFTQVDAAVASLKNRERAAKQAKKTLNKHKPEEDEDEDGVLPKVKSKKINDTAEDEDGHEIEEDDEDEVEVEVEVEDEEEEEQEEEEEEEEEEDELTEEDDILADPSFDLDFSLDQDIDQIKEPMFSMTLSELLDEARVVPILVDGDQDVEITGIQFDSHLVVPGNMFIYCPGRGHLFEGQSAITEAVEKGAVVIVASMEVSVQETVKAVVLVEDTLPILSSLSAAFYGNPSKEIPVISISGSNRTTTTSYLLKSIYEAMQQKTGLLGSIANYIHSNKKVDHLSTSLDPVSLQKLIATMAHNGTEVCIMEVLNDATCKELDFDVAVFTDLIIDSKDADKSAETCKETITEVFSKMVDPRRHAKVVNIDDEHAPYFAALGSPDVPIITYSMDNKEADVYALDVQLSLFETDLLVHTPRGNLEISSGLLGRDNVYSILAAVAVGVAVNAPLEDIVQGIEEVDAVPGRCELIDEEQAFAVIVDHAKTPDGLSRLLDTVRECGAQRVITVVGCEGECERWKRPIMAKVATDRSEVTILTSDNPRKEDPLYILDDMLAGVGWTMKEYLEHGERDYYPPLRNGNRIFLYDHRAIAVRAAIAMGEEGDAVIIAGKGHETYQIVGDKKEYLDDREECREALQHVDTLHAAGIDTSEFPWRFPESH